MRGKAPTHSGFMETGQILKKKKSINQFHDESANDVAVITSLNILHIPHRNKSNPNVRHQGFLSAFAFLQIHNTIQIEVE